MNLHDIASSVISSINPLQDITIVSRGSYTTNDYGERVVEDGDSVTVKADVQPVSSEDIKFINNYEESSVYKAFWVSSDVSGLNRPLAKSGDKIILGDRIYYVTSMNEDWYSTSGWNHFIAVLKLGEANGNT